MFKSSHPGTALRSSVGHEQILTSEDSEVGTNGVWSPSGPQSYGIVAAGATVTQAFTFTAAGSCGGTIAATLQLQEGTNWSHFFS